MKILGRIEYFNSIRRFGFVYDMDGTQRFFHVSSVVSGTPVAGRLAQYEPGETSKGPVALDIEILVGSSGLSVPVGIAGLGAK